jgi:hypothetical protein
MPYPSSTPTLLKDPSATLDYGIDLASSSSWPPGGPWLAAGETVTELTVTADPGLTVNSQSINTNSNGVAGALLVGWISGGVAGNSYYLHFTFTTSAGRTDTRSILIQCTTR